MSLVHVFMEELELIQDEKFRGFVVDALDQTPDFYAELTTFVNETKKALEYSKTFLEVLDSTDEANDIVVSAILLQDITRFYLDEDGDVAEDPIHPLSVRQSLMNLVNIIGLDKFDDIMRVVESSHGFNSPVPQVIPEINDPVYVWILPFVNQLAKERA